MDIKIGVGFGEFVFGMSEDDVINKFGEPNKIYFSDIGEPFYEYNKQQVILKFELEYGTENKRLALIEIKNKNAMIKGYLLWDISRDKIKKLFEKVLNKKAFMEDYETIDTICFDDYWLEFRFELGKLTSINIGVLLDENDRQIWKNCTVKKNILGRP